MKRVLIALPFILLLANASLYAADDPKPAAAPMANPEQTLTGHVFAKKKDSKADALALFKTDAATLQLVPANDDVGKQIKALMNQGATAKGTIKDDTMTVTSIEKKGGAPAAGNGNGKTK
jgi:hypothetical protein